MHLQHNETEFWLVGLVGCKVRLVGCQRVKVSLLCSHSAPELPSTKAMHGWCTMVLKREGENL